MSLILNKKIGDYVNKGEILATIYANNLKKAKDAKLNIIKNVDLYKELKLK